MADVLVRIGELNHLTGGAVSCDTSFHAVQCLAIHLSIEEESRLSNRALESTTSHAAALLCYCYNCTVCLYRARARNGREGRRVSWTGPGVQDESGVGNDLDLGILYFHCANLYV